VARGNGERLGLEVAWVVADGVPAGEWDGAVANLPYVADGEALAPEIVRHEPRGALFAGVDGLDALRAVAAVLRAPWVALEHGAAQGAAVRALLDQAGYGEVVTHRDLAGHDRVTTGARRS
jgi:release factor glutamine methyltransferase